MKRITLMILVLVSCITTYAQGQQIFSYSNTGDIVANVAYIDTFANNKVYTNITPYEFKQSGVVTTKSNDKYTVRLLKYKDWEDFQDFNVIEILYKNKQIFSFNNNGGWMFFELAEGPDGNASKPMEIINFAPNCTALAFTSHIYESSPYPITVIVLKDGKATLVYNKNAYLNDVKKNSDSTMFTLQLNTIEYYEEGKTNDVPILKSLIFKDGMIYYK